MTLKVKYLAFSNKRPFGMEIELSPKIPQHLLEQAIRKADQKHQIHRSGVYSRDYGNNYWHVKFDRSCSDVKDSGVGGWEIASYKGRGYKDVALMGKAIKEVKLLGTECNKQCAVHVHVDISDFRSSDAGSLVANWMKAERVIAQTVPDHRRKNEYCVLLNDKFANLSRQKKYTANEFWTSVAPRNDNDNNRRVALNMANYAMGTYGRLTAEIRLPDALMDEEDIKNWIRFFVSMVETSHKNPFPQTIAPVENVDDALTICGLHGESPFVILSKALRETKMWFLNRLIKNSNVLKMKEQARDRLDLMSTKRVEPERKSYYEIKEEPKPSNPYPYYGWMDRMDREEKAYHDSWF